MTTGRINQVTKNIKKKWLFVVLSRTKVGKLFRFILAYGSICTIR